MLNAEIPVLAHLGLTPQSVHQLGGFKVQGKLQEKAREIFQDALALEKLGVFAIVLESIPQELAKKITDSVRIPTIGIGAGRFCDGQVLVFPDLVGFTNVLCPSSCANTPTPTPCGCRRCRNTSAMCKTVIFPMKRKVIT